MPQLSVLTPTLNAQNVLDKCLASLRSQTYHDFEVIIADGGSTDATLKIAKKYHSKIVKNRLKTAEAGKAAALKKAKGKYILLLDSDNILPDKSWLQKMMQPLLNNTSSVIGSEPWRFTYRRQAGFIERYSALIGANDPYAWFTKNIDKLSYLSPLWPFPELIDNDQVGYLLLKLSKNRKIPTIGANGTIFKTQFLKENLTSDYLFDIDIISQALQKQDLLFAKVKLGIIHTYCESSIPKFIRKQTRRLTDLYFYQSLRHTNWQTKPNSSTNILFVFYSFLVLPPLVTAIFGYLKKSDIAWFFHPMACFLTAYIYTKETIKYNLGLSKLNTRNTWSQ